MAVYLVSYDLNNEKNYPAVEERISRYTAHQRVLYSEWLVQSPNTALQVATDIEAALDSDDGLLVVEVTRPTSWRNLRITDADMDKWVGAARA